MPIYAYQCASDEAHEFEKYVPMTGSPNPSCEKCGADTEKIWRVSKGRDWGGYPYVTRNLTPDGSPITVENPSHEATLCKMYGKVKRDDAGWIDTEYVGYNPYTGRQEYKEGSGRGMPGCWV